MNTSPNEVCAVIVTYGNRFTFLERVLQALRNEQVGHVVVVSNGSAEESTTALVEMYKDNKAWLTPILLSENSGSAGGFSHGLQFFSKTKYALAWLLDDDNMPLPGSLSTILNYWNKLTAKEQKKQMMVAFRKDRLNYQKAVQTKQPNLVLGSANAFLGIHLASVIRRLIGRRSQTSPPDTDIRFGPIDVAPYGGMLVSRAVLKNVGYPNEAYYLYGDDLEFSYRFTKQGGRIILALDSLIEDIDPTWHIAQPGSKFMKRLREQSQFRLYYSIRNRVHFDRTMRVNNKAMWYLNMGVYTLATLVLGIFLGRWHNTVTYLRAVRDGLTGKLGINTHYTLP